MSLADWGGTFEYFLDLAREEVTKLFRMVWKGQSQSAEVFVAFLLLSRWFPGISVCPERTHRRLLRKLFTRLLYFLIASFQIHSNDEPPVSGKT